MECRGEKGPAQLRGHIARAHFSGVFLPIFRVARFDIDLARKLEIPLGWVVKQGIIQMERGWVQDLKTRDEDTENMLRTLVVKNLQYIEQVGSATVNWEEVFAIYPAARALSLDINGDSFDPEFDE